MTDLLTESEFVEEKPYSNALPKFHVKFTPQKHVQQTTFISPKSRKIFPRYLNMLYCMGWFLGGPPTPQRMYTQRTTMSPPLPSRREKHFGHPPHSYTYYTTTCVCAHRSSEKEEEERRRVCVNSFAWHSQKRGKLEEEEEDDAPGGVIEPAKRTFWALGCE